MRGSRLKVYQPPRNIVANDMTGIDATIDLGEGTQLKTEVSRSGKLDGSVYLREQEDGFGLGQQRGSENATRKMGLDGSYQVE